MFWVGSQHTDSYLPFDISILVIPWLDIKDKKDADYSDMCLNLFR